MEIVKPVTRKSWKWIYGVLYILKRQNGLNMFSSVLWYCHLLFNSAAVCELLGLEFGLTLCRCCLCCCVTVSLPILYALPSYSQFNSMFELFQHFICLLWSHFCTKTLYVSVNCSLDFWNFFFFFFGCRIGWQLKKKKHSIQRGIICSNNSTAVWHAQRKLTFCFFFSHKGEQNSLHNRLCSFMF